MIILFNLACVIMIFLSFLNVGLQNTRIFLSMVLRPMHIIGESVRNRTQGEGIVILVKNKLEQHFKINEILFDTIV